MFKNLSLKAKLLGSFAISALCLALVGGIAFWNLSEVVNTYSVIPKNNVPNIVSMAGISDKGHVMATVVARITESTLSREQLAPLQKNFEKAEEDIAKYTKDYLAVDFIPGEEVLWNVVDGTYKTFAGLAKKALSMTASANPDDLKERDRIIANEYSKASDDYMAAVDKLIAFHQGEAKKWAGIAEHTAGNAKALVLGLIAIGFLVSMGFGYFLARSLSSSLTDIAKQLSSGAEDVASAAVEISSTSEELSSAATEQAASLQETASSVEEMSAMIRKNSDNANRSKDTSEASRKAAQKGKAVVEEMLEAIKAIDDSNREIGEVVKVISDIGSKTKVINDIVFKTQLLSFNASVEAARAGEQGKGFAVVAEEVGNLADLSGNAANQISSLLEESLAKVEAMIARSKQKVEGGIDISKRCSEVLDDIVNNVGDVNGMVDQIATASHEQSRGINEITKAMNQLDKVTQQNASASQQAASSSEQMSAQAQILKTAVRSLLSEVNGGGHGTRVVQYEDREPEVRYVAKSSKAKAKGAKVTKLEVVDGVSARKSADLPAPDDVRFNEAA